MPEEEKQSSFNISSSDKKSNKKFDILQELLVQQQNERIEEVKECEEQELDDLFNMSGSCTERADESLKMKMYGLDNGEGTFQMSEYQ